MVLIFDSTMELSGSVYIFNDQWVYCPPLKRLLEITYLLAFFIMPAIILTILGVVICAAALASSVFAG